MGQGVTHTAGQGGGERDILGARRAGIDAVLVDTLGRYPGSIDCVRISRLSELLDLLP